MPVIELSLSRLKSRARNKLSEEEILEALPYVGLDLEDREEDKITVEYSPNRPDFCSEAGIARSLMGLLGIEVGLPKFEFAQGSIKINVEGNEIRSVRPYIFSLYASLNVSEEVIKQLIVMQEDLHNGLGRRRAKVAIGIHNAEMVKPPIKYFATNDDSFTFVPLGSKEKMSIQQILQSTDQGTAYGKLLSRGLFPLLIDSSGNTLSMPPIINGELTRLKQGIRSIFVDVTATEKQAGETTIAIIAQMLADIGASVESVAIKDEDGSINVTPNMMPETTRFDLNLSNEILGLELSYEEARAALEKSRLELLSQDQAKIPRFRSDIIHPIDLAEEVELGYGVMKLKPQRTKTYLSGSLTEKTKRLQKLVDVLIGLGLTQIESLSLTSRTELALDPNLNLKVEDPKSQSYEYLRSQALPSLLQVLSQSTHEEYPQRVFEQVAVFRKYDSADTQVVEEEHAAAAIADSTASYTIIRSVLDGFLRLALKPSDKIVFEPSPIGGPIFAKGRTATFSLLKAKQKSEIGTIGEVSPEVLERLGLRVPVAAFELNLDPILND
jgi:phenylalanyl-tRNA synthetase beta chain